MVFSEFLDPILNPLLATLGPFWFVIVISFLVTLITTIVYKYATDQVLMKQLKEEMNALNLEAKKHIHDQKKAMAIHNQIMQKNFGMMRHSLTASAITLLPLLILFGWLNAHLMFVPLAPDIPFTVSMAVDSYKGPIMLTVPKGLTIVDAPLKNASKVVNWTLSGNEGEYLAQWKLGSKAYSQDVIVSSRHIYAPQLQKINDGMVKTTQINYQKLVVVPVGFRNWFGWFGTYVILVLALSGVLRKMLKVY